MSELRKEIVEAQKVRAEILKWKLILVAVLGGVGLGLSDPQKAIPNAHLVLLLIPMVCFYVDLLCKHAALRINVIGSFLRQGAQDEEGAYENFVARTRVMGQRGKMNIFALEEWALDGSTVVLSVLVVLVAVIPGHLGVKLTETDEPFFIASGLAGLVLTCVVRWVYQSRLDALKDLVVAGSKPA